jgi:hypothetical protein
VIVKIGTFGCYFAIFIDEVTILVYVYISIIAMSSQ